MTLYKSKITIRNIAYLRRYAYATNMSFFLNIFANKIKTKALIMHRIYNFSTIENGV